MAGRGSAARLARPARDRRAAALATSQVFLSMPLSRAELTSLELRDRLHLADLGAGRATAAAIHELRASATLSVRLAELGYGRAEDAQAAQGALDLVADGQPLPPAALAAVARFVDYLAAQREAAPRGRILEAQGWVKWR